MNVGAGSAVEVAVGRGEAAGAGEAADVAEAADVLVASGEGPGCEVQAFNRTSTSVMERMSAFMRAIMMETRPCVNVTKTGAKEHLAPVVRQPASAHC